MKRILLFTFFALFLLLLSASAASAFGMKDVIRMHQDWPERSGPTVFLVGIAPRRLFGPLPESDRRKLFAQFDHLNENGQRYFTRALIPALLRVYESSDRVP